MSWTKILIEFEKKGGGGKEVTCEFCIYMYIVLLRKRLERVWIQITKFQSEVSQCVYRGRINPCPRSLLRFLQRFEGSDAVAEITGFDAPIDLAHRYTEPSIQTRTIDFSLFIYRKKKKGIHSPFKLILPIEHRIISVIARKQTPVKKLRAEQTYLERLIICDYLS